MNYFDKAFFKFLFGFLCLISLAIGVISYANSVSAQSSLININTADSTLLQTLNGIGAVKAQAIIDYRTLNGPFQAIEDIQNVSGIGPATFNNIKSFITVGSTTAPPVVESVINTNNSTSNTSSVHYSSTPVTNVNKRIEMYVSAGRDRVGTAGSPLEFISQTHFEYTKSSIFNWNFGDGSLGAGSIITHTYEYPGEYIVILNASLPQSQAVARVNVKIVEPDIKVVLASPEKIELKNNSSSEINLYGRTLWHAGKVFLFPKDTIIMAGQSISFSSKVTDLRPNGTNDVRIIVVGDTEQPKVMAKIEEEKTKQIASIKNQIASLEQQMASIPQPHLAVQPPSEKSEEIIEETKNFEPQTAAVVKSGWFETLKRFFLRK